MKQFISIPVVSQTAKLERTSEQLVPEDIKLDRSETNTLSTTPSHGSITVSDIINGLMLNEFSVAREVAIQTYTKDWFDNESNITLIYDLATALGNTFGTDGYRNVVWDTISGLDKS